MLGLLNQKGFLHISALIFILALIGAWFIYRSYKEERLQENLAIVTDDYKILVLSKVKGLDDRRKVKESFDTIQTILSKYTEGVPVKPMTEEDMEEERNR